MTAYRIVDRWHRLKTDRSTHEAVWQEIAEYLRPLRAEFLAQTRTPGAKRDAKVFDSTPLIAADNFTGGIYSMMTNPANRWFALKLEDEDLNDYAPARDWLYAVETRLLNSFGPQISRFYTVIPALYADLACFGNAVFSSEEVYSGERRILDRTHALADIYQEAGLPAGALNIITGFGERIGDALTTHPLVKAVMFTGSSRVGKHIAALCGTHMKRVILELGGKSPLIVLADADLEQAADAAAFSVFFFQGQACMAASRIYVERPVYEQFCTLLKARAEAHGLGDLRDPQTWIGPIISERQRRRVRHHIEDAVAKGARVLTGGTWSGNRCRPTILLGVEEGMTVCREETFGPVTSIYPVDSADEAMRCARDTVYGLSAAIHTRDINKALPMALAMNSGMVHINAPTIHDEPHVPFGGTGDSGFGREGTDIDIDTLTDWKWITVQLPMTP